MNKIALFGYRRWAGDIFQRLANDSAIRDRYELLHVNTVPSKEGDYSCIGVPERIIDPKDTAALESYFREHTPDISLFYGWSWFVPAAVTDAYKCVCLHPSLLPKYRGGSPLQHQIINGEREGGVTLFRMTQGMDEGDILKQKRMSLAGELDDVLSRIVAIGTDLSTEMLLEYTQAEIRSTPQDHKQATVYARRKRAESRITADELHGKPKRLYDKVRALQDPYPNAYLELPGSTLYVRKAAVVRRRPKGVSLFGDGSYEDNIFLPVGDTGAGLLITEYRLEKRA